MPQDACPKSKLYHFFSVLRFIPLLSLMMVIFYLSHTPGDNFPPMWPGMDKLAHMSAYAVLAAAFLFAIIPFCRNSSFLPCAASTLFFCLVYGIADEFHQSFIPGRSPDVKDIVADLGGAIVTLVLWKTVLRKKH